MSGLLAVKDKGVYIYNSPKEREELGWRYVLEQHKFFDEKGAWEERVNAAKKWANTNKLFGFKFEGKFLNYIILMDLKEKGIQTTKITKNDKTSFYVILNDLYEIITKDRLTYNNGVYSRSNSKASPIEMSSDFSCRLKISKIFEGVSYEKYIDDFIKEYEYTPWKKLKASQITTQFDEITFECICDDLIKEDIRQTKMLNTKINITIYDEEILDIEPVDFSQMIADKEVLDLIKSKSFW